MSVFPNPFSSITTIQYTLAEDEKVSVKVFDMYGHLVNELVNAKLSAGHHTINFERNALPDGVYMVELRTAHQIENKKLLMIK